ncbi:MAG TPA: hypothetical protein VFS21_34710 [Roseiflexaceae bacterium]|nr:hypothetical protein [Roseiflexaceae bacterium]
MDLHDAIDHYHRLLDPDSARATFEQLDVALRTRGLLVGRDSRLICSVLRPRFVTEAQYNALIGAATLIGRAVRKVGMAALEDQALLQPYALTSDEQALLAIDPGYPGASVFGRLDGFLAPDGSSCYFVESNLESPAGIAYDEALAEIFGQFPVLHAFQERFHAEPLPVRPALQQLLLDTYRAWGGSGTPTVAIVDFRGVATWPEFEHLRERFGADGIPTLLADPSELRYEGGRLRAGDTPIDLVYRRVLQHEFLAAHNLDHPLVRAYADGAVCVVNPFRSKPVHTKLIMALLSDQDGAAHALLDEDERAAVQRHVPWSRLLREGVTRYGGERIDLLAFARSNRERLVLKPNDEYGGAGVLLGWETPQEHWEQALDAALGAPHIVQERVPLPEEHYPTWTPEQGLLYTPRYVDSDPCVFGDRALGCLTRIAATALLNVSAGGGSAPPTFLIRERSHDPA